MKVPCIALATDESGTVVAAAHGNRLGVLRCDTDGHTQLLLSFDAPPTAAAPRATLRAVCVAASGTIVACGGDDKVVRVWDTAAAPSLIAARPCPKRVTAVAIDAERHVVFSDKFGDVYRFADASSASTTTTKVDEDRECILGHMSMLTCMALSADGRLIATGDRDEKVRVSRFPAAYDIAAFCLGHTASVMGLVFLGERLLASGGSDGTLRLWHADTGAEACAPVHLAPATAAASAADASAVVVPVGWHAATGALAVIVEGHNDVLIFDEHLVLRETLPTAAPPLSCAFVRGGHLLVALTDGSVIVLSPAGADAAAQRSSLFLADAVAGNAPEAESAEAAAALVADAWRGNMRRVKSAENDGDEDEGSCHHAAKRKKKAEADQ